MGQSREFDHNTPALGLSARTRRRMRWLRDHKEFPTLVVVLLLSGFAWAFIELADLVLDGRTHAFDAALLQGLRNPGDVSDPIGPEWVEEMGRDVTALGGVAVLTLITLAVSGFLLLQGLWRSMWLVLASVGGGLAVSTLFKQSFERARPELVPYETAVYTASFPSGHSMMAAVTYLTLGVLLARVQPNRLIKVYLLAIACFITLAVGVSRVYLGVHWPTDVLAGWSAGAAWALLCWTVARWLGRHGRIEPEKDEKRDPRATPR